MGSVLDTASLVKADPAHVLVEMANFRNVTGDGWLGINHPVKNGAILPLSWAAASSLAPTALIQAVAASAPNHCIDGWSFASRSISALISGDGHAARHLAYYAQLRAGLSILANLGVGIFNRINFAITSSGAILRIDTAGTSAPRLLGMGTHDIVWEALKAWVSESGTASAFLDLIKVRNSSLADIIQSLWPGGSYIPAAGSIIENWGLDLKRGREEHKSRNISSYSPQELNLIGFSPSESLDFIAKAWRLFEPTSSSSFDQLDRFLLRRVLQSQHRSLTGHSRYSEGAIEHRYDELPPTVRSLASKSFLLGKTEPRNPELIVAARSNAAPAKPIQMIARALLLLRTATSLTHSSFISSGVSCSAGDTRPWIDRFAEERGFWAPGAPLPDTLDLWEDVELALIDFDASINPPPASWNEWMIQDQKGLPTITQAERIGVWSLGG